MAASTPAPRTANGKKDASANFLDPHLYVNRELALLNFQSRVLEEARDTTNPLLERVRFLSIVGSNLNEFFMVRMASLTAQLDAGIPEFGPDRMSPSAQLVAARREIKRLMETAHQCLEKELKPALADEGIHIVEYSELTSEAVAGVQTLFRRDHFSGADAAGLRSRPAVPAHFEPEPEPGGLHRGRRGRRALRARQGSRFAAATGAGDTAAQLSGEAGTDAAQGVVRLDRAGDRGQSRRAVPGDGGGGGASRFTSRATPISRSRNWKRKTCWRPSRKASGSAGSAAWFACR